MSRYGPAVTSLLALTAVGFLWSRTERLDADEVRRPRYAPNTEVAEELERLRRDVGLLRSRHASQGLVTSGGSCEPPEREPERVPPTPPSVVEGLAIDHLERELANEHADPAFESQVSRDLVDVMNEVGEETGTELGELRCGTNFCRLIVSHADRTLERAFLGGAVGFPPFNDNVYTLTDEGVAGLVTTRVYFSRRGVDLPLNITELGG